ncbi:MULTISPECIES: TetR/AcrR family transcriptional regulator [unclassified Streptomyces]|uniref:TetR/AcrR family transcriptional regulator n=1 Tax=unclassified Streptomyces TaxID=2593676 RepID=UPI00081DC60A|nr:MULTISPECIES: TetR family transcriptional regulator [unclassified Streptomyces]MYR93787.1 TetR family transcriptional regulator [Streptomyces sp. SID4937]SCD59241.1 transcriptional regulator, TetR family [Streptomyces sp. ScaeMP-e83]
MAAPHTDGRIARGNQTRELILRRTVDIASVEGLDGLSLGRLATELKLSKSGVFALFGSKENLQLATVRTAVARYTQHVVRPAEELPPGIARLWRLCTAWQAYSRDRVFPGDCFFYAVSAEYDAREGQVHDVLATVRARWSAYVEETVRGARAAGELAEETDVPQLAFEIAALLELANAESVLHDEFGSYDKAAKGIHQRLRAAATDPVLLPER